MEAPKMSVLRRHRILADDVRRVIAHLKAHKKITANDIISRPRLKKKKDAGPTETVRRGLRSGCKSIRMLNHLIFPKGNKMTHFDEIGNKGGSAF